VLNEASIIATAHQSQALLPLPGGRSRISLVVGGIGIMNMMLTTVTGTYREIGLRKQLALRKDIINNF